MIAYIEDRTSVILWWSLHEYTVVLVIIDSVLICIDPPCDLYDDLSLARFATIVRYRERHGIDTRVFIRMIYYSSR